MAAAIIASQADLAWNWGLPGFFVLAAIFALMHAVYTWANRKPNMWGRRAWEVEERL
ncbi:hypothetical protein [Corynebacterium nasicanis]|uniref:Uncharacterized protein n=1 Tax=Corynebacterium nasicanis TaxID=1448267 RepID=A0ABW1QET2_9CORY